MDGRYEVFATHGKGVFSTVLRAHDKAQLDASGKPLEVCSSIHACKCCRCNMEYAAVGSSSQRWT